MPRRTLMRFEWRLSRWATTTGKTLVGSLNDDNKCTVNWTATTDHQILLTVAQIFPSLKKQHYLRKFEKRNIRDVSNDWGRKINSGWRSKGTAAMICLFIREFLSHSMINCSFLLIVNWFFVMIQLISYFFDINRICMWRFSDEKLCVKEAFK